VYIPDHYVPRQQTIEPLQFRHELEGALELIADLPNRIAVGMPAMLDVLFADLKVEKDADAVEEIEDNIWELWSVRHDLDLDDRMQHAIAAISQQAWGDAEAVLNDLVRDVPDWAEVFNKRATLYHLIDRDTQSVADIQRVLKLEPRHFGALSGLGKICLRHDEAVTALFAFDAALNVHPNLDNVRGTAESLRRQIRTTLN